MRNGCLIVLLGVISLAGCTSKDVWQADAQVAPISYDAEDNDLNRTIGKLRKLAVLPGKFEVTRDGEAEGTKDLSASFVNEAAYFLEGERGYAVAPLTPGNVAKIEDAVLDRLLRECSAILAGWENAGAAAAVAPCADRIGRHLGVDGLVVVSGSRNSDRQWRVIATLLTASLAWPLLMSQEQIESSAGLFEVASGDLVWRSSFSKSAIDTSAISATLAVGFLFEGLEHALPEALTQ
jgi:hypothetical protein